MSGSLGNVLWRRRSSSRQARLTSLAAPSNYAWGPARCALLAVELAMSFIGKICIAGGLGGLVSLAAFGALSEEAPAQDPTKPGYPGPILGRGELGKSIRHMPE